MHIRNILLCGFASAMLAACAAPVTPEQKAAFEQSAARPIICHEGHDCVDKWHQAIKWVRDNSKTKIQTMSGNVITTAVATTNDDWWSYTVNRNADGKRKYAITLTPACSGIFGCSPSELQLRASFADALLGKVPSKTGGGTAAPTFGSIRQLEPQIRKAMDRCEAERKQGAVKDYRASVECSNPKINKIFKGASYPYTDLARGLMTKRMKLAKQVDSKQLTADEMDSKVKDEFASIEKRERQRNSAPPAAPTPSEDKATAAPATTPPAVSALSDPVATPTVGTASASRVRR